MSYTLGEAARATGMSKAAISRAIKNGTLSAERLDSGSFKIEPAELHRVYPPVAQKQADATGDATPSNGSVNGEIRELRAKLEAATQRLSDKDSTIDDLREDRDHWRTQAERLLIADQRTTEQPPRRRWFGFGKQS
jgi:DNA-directed RNA polymerase specialized sigma54-like protein